MHVRLLTIAAIGLALVVGPLPLLGPAPAAAQIARAGVGQTRKAATIAGLVRFPFYFHTQPIRVRGLATEKDGQFQLEHEGAHVWLVPGGTGKLVVYELSAADGSRIHQVEIPLTFIS